MKKLNNFAMTKLFSIIAVLLLSFSAVNAQSVDEGKRLIELGKYEAAKNLFEGMAKSDPKNTTAHYFLGKLNILDSQYVAAEENFNNGLKIDKDSPLNLVGKGWLLLIKNDSTGAIKFFEDAIDETDKKDINTALEIADAYMYSPSTNWSRPVELLKNALKANKQKADIYAKMGDLFMKNYNGSKAIENYKIASNLDETMAKAYIGIGMVYTRIKNYAEAENNFQQAITVDSVYPAAYREYADFFNTVRNYSKAADMYKKYIDLSDASPEKLEKYATYLYLGKRYQEAVDVIKSISGNVRNQKQLQHVLAWAYYSLDDAQNGIPAFEKYFSMVKPEEKSATDYEFYGKLLAKAGQDSLAVENYKMAVQMDSSKSDLYSNIADSYYKRKNFDKAAQFYAAKENLAKKPLSLIEYFNWGQSNYFMKNYQKADSVFAKLATIKPDLPVAYQWRAISLSAIDSTSEQGLAKPHYEKLIEVVSTSPDSAKYKGALVQAYSYLGYFYYLKREDPQYKEDWLQNYEMYWRKVLALDPKNVQANAAIENLKILKKKGK